MLCYSKWIVLFFSMLDYSLLIYRYTTILAYWFHMVWFCRICLLDLVGFLECWGFYAYKIMTSLNRNNFILFQLYSFIFLTKLRCQELLIMLNISGKCAHSYCSYLKGETFSLSSLNMMLAVNSLYMAFNMFREFSSIRSWLLLL